MKSLRAYLNSLKTLKGSVIIQHVSVFQSLPYNVSNIEIIEISLLPGVKFFGEPYPTTSHNLKSIFWLKIYLIYRQNRSCKTTRGGPMKKAPLGNLHIYHLSSQD